MIAIRTKREIALLRRANEIVAEVRDSLAARVVPGITTRELDEGVTEIIREAGGEPSFLGYQGYPKATCISVDEVIVHGIPGDRSLREGEIVSIDVGVNYRGYYGDSAITVPCGKIDDRRAHLLYTTRLALERGIDAARAGNYLGDISKVVQETCEAEGFSIVRNFVGHGIGSEMHEDPQIPNFYTGRRGPKLKAGMVIAIEPMVNIGTPEVALLDDGWTAVTADGMPSAHFEHSIVVQDGDAIVLSLSCSGVLCGGPVGG